MSTARLAERPGAQIQTSGDLHPRWVCAPIPKAIVAQMISTFPLLQLSWFSFRSASFIPAWYGIAVIPLGKRGSTSPNRGAASAIFCAMFSQSRCEKQ